MIYMDGANFDPLNFKVNGDCKLIQLFKKFAVYNDMDLQSLTFMHKGVELETSTYGLTIAEMKISDQDTIKVVYNFDMFMKCL